MRRSTFYLLAFLFAVGSDFASAQQPASTKVKREGVITGRVFSEDGQPLPGAQVMALPAGKLMFAFSPAMTTTDEEGNFKLSGLSHGSYFLSFKSPGYVEARDSSNLQLYRIGENVSINMIKGGVITGRVTDESGEPMVGIRVSAQRARDLKGNSKFGEDVFNDGRASQETDDRGVYRIYGLDPGVYQVKSAGLLFPFSGGSKPILGGPTYHPSNSKGSAVEVTLHSGEEINNIDIRFRNLRGHSISGTFAGDIDSGGFFNAAFVILQSIADKQVVGTSTVSGGPTFSIHGIEDGEYELLAAKFNDRFDIESSPPRRITVKGADVTGIELRLLKLGSISGTVIVEAANPGETCKDSENFTIEEILIKSKHDDPLRGTSLSSLFADQFPFVLGRGQPDEKGEFTLKNLEPGRVRLSVDLPGVDWYVRAITQKIPSAAKPVDLSQSAIGIKAGEKISRIEISIARGAASLNGKVVPAGDTGKLPGRIRVHLIPAEVAAANDLLRYAETLIDSAGNFKFEHLAPGKYWLLAKPVAGEEINRPAVWETLERAKLRREAEASKNEIELRICHRVKDHILRMKL